MTKSKVAARLHEERDRLVGELDALAAREHEKCPTDLLDMAELAMRRDEEARRTELIAHRLAEVDAALERLGRGVFGRCETCGGRIAAERLEIVPAARSCTAHADRRRRATVIEVDHQDLLAPSGAA